MEAQYMCVQPGAKHLTVDSNYILRVGVEPLCGLVQKRNKHDEVRRVVVANSIPDHLVVEQGRVIIAITTLLVVLRTRHNDRRTERFEIILDLQKHLFPDELR